MDVSGNLTEHNLWVVLIQAWYFFFFLRKISFLSCFKWESGTLTQCNPDISFLVSVVNFISLGFWSQPIIFLFGKVLPSPRTLSFLPPDGIAWILISRSLHCFCWSNLLVNSCASFEMWMFNLERIANPVLSHLQFCFHWLATFSLFILGLHLLKC